MITIDQSLVVDLVVLFWGANGLANIAVGAARWERPQRYGAFEVFWGVLTLIFVGLVLLA
jgi:hypothetical protein